MRQGVIEAHARGCRDVGLLIDANGTFGVGPIGCVTSGIILPVENPEKDVMLSNRSPGLASTRCFTWEELQSMDLANFL